MSTCRAGHYITICILIAIAVAREGRPADTMFSSPSGSWSTAGNWSNGVPSAADNALVNNGNTALIDSGFTSSTINALYVGADSATSGTLSGSGTVTQAQPNEALTVATNLLLGSRASPTGQTGTYNLRSGILNVNQTGGTISGGLGGGAFNFDGGTLRVKTFDATNLGGKLVQTSAYSFSSLDASVNSTSIIGGYDFRGGSITVGAGQSINVSGLMTVSTANAHYIQGAGTFNAGGGVVTGPSSTLDYFGTGTLNIGGPQSSDNAELRLFAGTTNINSDFAAGHLTIRTFNGAPAAVNFNSNRELSRLDVMDGSIATLSQNGTPGFPPYVGNNKHLLTESLNVASTGKLDITNNAVVVNYASGSSPLASITASITSGAHVVGGIAQWDSNGITSSTAHADVVANPASALTAVGVLDIGDPSVNPGYNRINNGDFNIGGAGEALPASSVLVKYTYLGDSQLAGKVQFSDFLIWKAAFTANLAGGHVGGWAHAQFDYSEAQTTFADFLIWKNSFSKTLAGLLPTLHSTGVNSGSSLATVPEPSAVILAFIGLIGLLGVGWGSVESNSVRSRTRHRRSD